MAGDSKNGPEAAPVTQQEAATLREAAPVTQQEAATLREESAALKARLDALEAIVSPEAKKLARVDISKPTEARVLMDCCVYGKANAVVTLKGNDLKMAVESGSVDVHPDAVAYAKSLA